MLSYDQIVKYIFVRSYTQNVFICSTQIFLRFFRENIQHVIDTSHCEVRSLNWLEKDTLVLYHISEYFMFRTDV